MVNPHQIRHRPHQVTRWVEEDRGFQDQDDPRAVPPGQGGKFLYGRDRQGDEGCEMIEMIGVVPFADLKNRLANARKIISEQANRVSVAERQVRDIAKDRDIWQARALSAEAKLMSFGIDAALSEKS